MSSRRSRLALAAALHHSAPRVGGLERHSEQRGCTRVNVVAIVDWCRRHRGGRGDPLCDVGGVWNACVPLCDVCSSMSEMFRCIDPAGCLRFAFQQQQQPPCHGSLAITPSLPWWRYALEWVVGLLRGRPFSWPFGAAKSQPRGSTGIWEVDPSPAQIDRNKTGVSRCPTPRLPRHRACPGSLSRQAGGADVARPTKLFNVVKTLVLWVLAREQQTLRWVEDAVGAVVQACVVLQACRA